MPLMFENATDQTGLQGKFGMSYALAWGDANSDGFPDFWISHHNPHALVNGTPDFELYQLAGKQFVEIGSRVPRIFKDYHGVTWADYDNDGDKDIAQTTGGTRIGGVTLFENDGGTFTDVTNAVGLSVSSNDAGRNSVWLDYDNDGLLDFYLGATRVSSGGDNGGPSTIYHQATPGHFVDANIATGLSIDGVDPYIADLNGDGHPELILCSYGRIKAIFDTTTTPWHNIQDDLLGGVNIPTFDDVTFGDFNNDLRTDIYITRRGFDDEVLQQNSTSLRSYIAAVPAGEQYGFSFKTTGDLTFILSQRDASINYNQIYVGASGRHPITDLNDTTFTLSATTDAGIVAHNLTTPGIYIGYDTAAGVWEYEVVGSAKASRGNLIQSTAAITNLETTGFPLTQPPEGDQVLINTGSGFQDRTVAWGVAPMRIAGQHVATGDFDNNGRLDLYIDQSGPAGNRGNLVLLGRWGDSFYNSGSNGAAGPVRNGIGGPVALADYDHDGFLDVLTNNAAGEPPFIPLNTDGPLRLYHNTGNDKNWIEVRLHGLGYGHTNADGIGAKVIVKSGNLQQMREEVGGQHDSGQDFSDLHFGMMGHSRVGSLEVHWPSGAVDRFTQVPVNQIIDITEGSSPASGTGQQSFLETAPDTSLHAAAENGPSDHDVALLMWNPIDSASWTATDGETADVDLSLLMADISQSPIDWAPAASDQAYFGSEGSTPSDIAAGDALHADAATTASGGGDALLV